MQVCRQLLRYFQEELQLEQHLRSIRAVFCFGAVSVLVVHVSCCYRLQSMLHHRSALLLCARVLVVCDDAVVVQGYRMEAFCAPVFQRLADNRVSEVQHAASLTEWLRSALLTDMPMRINPAVALHVNRTAPRSPVVPSCRAAACGGGSSTQRSHIASPSNRTVSVEGTPPLVRSTARSVASSSRGLLGAGGCVEQSTLCVMTVCREHVARLSVALADPFASTPSKFLSSGFVVEYDAPWPLSEVLSESTMRGYRAIFSLLVRVKYVKSVLEDLHHNSRHLSAKQIAALKQYVQPRRWCRVVLICAPNATG
jgi:hypothetical protein